MHKARLSAVCISLLFLACGDLRETPTSPGGGSNPPDPTATLTRVQSEIFTPTCALRGCHDALGQQSGLVLTTGASHANLVGVKSVETSLDRVKAGDPDQSYVMRKVNGGPGITGDRMPQALPPLTEAQLNLLRDWIRRGAPND